MNRRKIFEGFASSRGGNMLNVENEEQKIGEDIRRKKLEEICKVECTNCEKWDQQKQCIGCEIFKTLSELKNVK